MNEIFTLKLLHRLKWGDTFEVEVAGFPTPLREVSGRLHFLRFNGTSLIQMEPEPLEIPITLGAEDEPGHRLLGIVPDRVAVGMYLLSGIILRGRGPDGRVVTGSLGVAMAPLIPRLGFCVDHDVCDSKRTEAAYEFVPLRLV